MPSLLCSLSLLIFLLFEAFSIITRKLAMWSLATAGHDVQSLVDGMRATCAEENAEGAQRVAIAHTELCARRDVLGFAPPVSVRVVELESDTLRQAVAGLCLHAAATVEACPCTACGASLPEHSPLCAACAEAVRVFEERGGDLRSASIGLQANKNVVLAAVARNSLQLAVASSRLQADRQVVMAAVWFSGVTTARSSVISSEMLW